jgi:hypothetical protein
MANRHKTQAKGFNVGGAALSYGNKDVVSEARKTGSNPGIKAIQKKDGGKVPGKKAGGRLDKRARGGGVSKSPFSSAGK